MPCVEIVMPSWKNATALCAIVWPDPYTLIA